jgi:hypothetical protein
LDRKVRSFRCHAARCDRAALGGRAENDWHLEIETGDIGAVQLFTLLKVG